MAGPVVVDWRIAVLRQAEFRRSDGRSLLVQYGGELEEWKALALEAPSHAEAHHVLDDHAHKIIGEFATERAARNACEAFARKWRRGKTIDACACKDIKAPLRRSKR